jgi:hypothetical protein
VFDYLRSHWSKRLLLWYRGGQVLERVERVKTQYVFKAVDVGWLYNDCGKHGGKRTKGQSPYLRFRQQNWENKRVMRAIRRKLRGNSTKETRVEGFRKSEHSGASQDRDQGG